MKYDYVILGARIGRVRDGQPALRGPDEERAAAGGGAGTIRNSSSTPTT